MKSSTYFITGIGTSIGKTIISTILVELLNADYFKPIQSGDLEHSDSTFVKNMLLNKKSYVHPETYRLKHPLSPHASAELDGIEIDINQITLPNVNNKLIVEGAGGLFVPLNQEYFIIDLIKKLQIPVILVSQHYLGSINHTLLSVQALKNYDIPIAGIIFNGEANIATEQIIQKHSRVDILGRIPIIKDITALDINKAGHYINAKL